MSHESFESAPTPQGPETPELGETLPDSLLDTQEAEFQRLDYVPAEPPSFDQETPELVNPTSLIPIESDEIEDETQLYGGTLAQMQARERAIRQARIEQTRTKVEAFHSPDPERHSSVLLGRIRGLQSSLDKTKSFVATARPQRDARKETFYIVDLDKKSKPFIDTLTSSELENEREDIELNESGLELIVHGLEFGDIPSLDQLVSLRELLDNQDIKKVPFDNLDPDAPEPAPRYVSQKTDALFGPFKEGQLDIVQKAYELTDTRKWLLTDDEKRQMVDDFDMPDIQIESNDHRSIRERGVKHTTTEYRKSFATKPYRYKWARPFRPKPQEGQNAPFRATRSWWSRLKGEQWAPSPPEGDEPPSESRPQPNALTYEDRINSWWKQRSSTKFIRPRDVKDIRVAQKAYREDIRNRLILDRDIREAMTKESDSLAS